MLRFTQGEFDTMVRQLLEDEQISYDMLCHIADKTLRPSVIYWCSNDESLKGRGYEEDIMQEIFLRLIKKTVDYFLLRDGVDGQVNLDPQGFEDWLFRVARNIQKDHANRVRARDIKTVELDGKETELSVDDRREGRTERLREAFDVVLEADVSVYKTLTWLAQCLFVLEQDITKIQSNRQILEKFSEKTLDEMYDSLCLAAGRIPWLRITEQQHSKIRHALDAPWDGEMTYGQVPYHKFFMKNNGEVSGKKSISDWVNRINAIVKRKLGIQYHSAEDSAGRKRGAGDGSSHS